MILSLSKPNSNDDQFFSTCQWFINIYLLNFTPDRNINKLYYTKLRPRIIFSLAYLMLMEILRTDKLDSLGRIIKKSIPVKLQVYNANPSITRIMIILFFSNI